MSSMKVYVDVMVEFTAQGQMLPKMLRWEDGQIFKIDQVKDIMTTPAFKAGGLGDRYTVILNGHEKYLFFEPMRTHSSGKCGRWFVERKG